MFNIKAKSFEQKLSFVFHVKVTFHHSCIILRSLKWNSISLSIRSTINLYNTRI